LKSVLPKGTVVRGGQVFGELENAELEMQIAVLTGERDRRQLRLSNLELRRADAPELASRIPTEREALTGVEARLRQRTRDQEELAIKASADGIIFPPPWRPETYTPERLSRHVGSPLELRSRGCFLPAGTLLCSIGDPVRREAVVLIEQADIAMVEPGQTVKLSLDETPGRVIRGTVKAVSSSQAKNLPDEFRGGELVALRRGADEAVPRETAYEARVTLEEQAGPLLMGTRGHAKISVEPLPVWRRLYGYAKRTFGVGL